MSTTKVSPDLLDLDAGITISVADNSDTLTLTSTDADATSGPVLNLYRNSASAADGDILGLIKFTGNSGGSGVHNYGQIRMENNGVTDNQEQGKLIFEVSMTDGTLSKAFNVGRTEISVNEDSKDLDFRVESDAATHAFFVQGSSGNVGIGTSSPSSKLHLESGSAHNKLSITSTASGSTGYDAAIDLLGSATNSEVQLNMGTNGDADREQIKTYQSIMSFRTNNSERMRIDDTGDIRFGIANAALTTAEVHTFYNGSKGNNLALYTQGADQHFSIDMWNHTGGSCNQVQFRGGQHGAVTGTITSTGDNATQYNTSSDYRLKENVDYTWDATTRLKQLKPAQFNWITDETNTAIDGFLAHEVSSVVPQAVTGEKDAVYEDGEPKYQGIDHSVLVPLLVKTIQELEARITTLEG